MKKVLCGIAVIFLASVVWTLLHIRDYRTEYYGAEYLTLGNHYTLTQGMNALDPDTGASVIRLGTFGGRKELWPDDETVTEDAVIDVKLSITSGHCKLIYVNEARTSVITLAECEEGSALEAGGEYHFRIKEGIGSLKLVGYDAEGVEIDLLIR